MSPFENPTPSHDEQSGPVADAPENPSRRNFLRKVLGAAATVAFDVAAGRPAQAAADALEGLGRLAEEREKDANSAAETGESDIVEEIEQLTHEPTTEDLKLEQLIGKIKERYGITVNFSQDAEFSKADARSIARAVFGEIDGNRVDIIYNLQQNTALAEKDRIFLRDIIARYRQAESDQQKSLLEEEFIARIGTQGHTGREFPPERKQHIIRQIYSNLQLYPEELLKTVSADQLQLLIAGTEPSLVRRIFEYFGKVKPSNVKDILGTYINAWAGDKSQIIVRDSEFGSDKNDSVATLHHELFHRMDDVFYGMSRDISDEVQDWRDDHLDGGGSSYFYSSDEHKAPGGDNGAVDIEEYRGFLNTYSKASPVEDRAVIAESLFKPSSYNILKNAAVRDKNIANKFDKIKQYYWHWSGGVMDERYWKYIESGDMDGAREYVRRRSQEQRGEQHSEQEERISLSIEQLAQQQRKEDERAAQEVLKKINERKQ